MDMIRTALSNSVLGRHPLVASTIVVVAFAQMQLAFGDIAGGSETIAGNARNVWYPFARTVLEGGAPYVAYWDNKPPVFQLVNVIAGLGGTLPKYTYIFYVMLGIVNGATAIAIWQLFEDRDYRVGGLVAVIVFLWYVPALGFQIDPRQFGNFFIVAAFLASSAWSAGSSMAVAGLYSQYAVLLVPVLAGYHVVDERVSASDAVTALAGFVVAGILVVVVSYGAIALIWSPEAAVHGFKVTFFTASNYTVRRGGPFLDPSYVVNWLGQHSLLVIGGVAGWAISSYQFRGTGDQLGPAAGVAFVALSTSIVIRGGKIYWVALLPLLSILIGMGIQGCIERCKSEERNTAEGSV
jgi:hypothetical protein